MQSSVPPHFFPIPSSLNCYGPPSGYVVPSQQPIIPDVLSSRFQLSAPRLVIMPHPCAMCVPPIDLVPIATLPRRAFVPPIMPIVPHPCVPPTVPSSVSGYGPSQGYVIPSQQPIISNDPNSRLQLSMPRPVIVPHHHAICIPPADLMLITADHCHG